MEKDIEAKGESPALRPDTTEGNVELPRAPTAFGRFIDSFRENPNARVTPEIVDADGKPLPDQPPAEPALAMKLKPRHLQMIAIGGSIGMISPFEGFGFRLQYYRYRSLCWFRLSVSQRRTSFINYCIWFDWSDVVLHCACSG